jgi:hypothetical protein
MAMTAVYQIARRGIYVMNKKQIQKENTEGNKI